MTGNDIIDLELAGKQSNWRRAGFLKKLFSRREQLEILNAQDPELRVWLFWSMKEAAYKAWQRKENVPPRFNPVEFYSRVKSFGKDEATGLVKIKNTSFYTESIFNKARIHSLAAYLPKEKLFWKEYGSKDNLQDGFLKEFSAQSGHNIKDLKINKSKFLIPQVLNEDKPLKAAISFSHHGKYSAFAYSLNNC